MKIGTWSRRLFLAAIALAQAFGQDTWTNVERIVAVGDVHGDYAALTTVLRSAGVIDARNRWAAGRAHLVQTGDMVDRGPDTRRALDLLMRLETQARDAGGMVHALIGNHEAMNLYGDLRYVAAEDFAAFRGADSERVRTMQYERHVRDLRKQGAPEPDDAYMRKWMTSHPPGFFERLAGFAPGGRYGRWIGSHNTVIRINDIVFVHAGIAPRFANTTIRECNERVREELRDFEKLKGGIVMDPEGPLWYRGFAQRSDESLGAHLSEVLERLGAKFMVAGHTPASGGAVTPRFGGRYIMIDVGLSQAYGSNRACLVVEGGRQYAVHRGRKVPLPQGSEADMLRYRSEIAEIDRAAR